MLDKWGPDAFMSEKPSSEVSDRYVSAFRWMLLARTLEDRIASLYRAGGKIVGGVYLGRGQEAFSTALGLSLSQAKGDIFGALIRDMSGRLAFGEPLLDPVRTTWDPPRDRCVGGMGTSTADVLGRVSPP